MTDVHALEETSFYCYWRRSVRRFIDSSESSGRKVGRNGYQVKVSSEEVSRCQVRRYKGVKWGGIKVSSGEVSRCQVRRYQGVK